MPLIILGLLAKFSRAAEAFNKSLNEMVKKAAEYTIVDDDYDPDDDPSPGGDKPDGGPGGNGTLFFPVDAEVEKRKRNIH